MFLKFLITLPGGSEWILIILALAGAIFWIKTLVDIANTTFNDSTKKTLWFLFVFFTGFLGAIFFAVYNGKSSTTV